MSIDATRWAWKQDLPPTRKLVLLSLADRADESHRCYPSIARLASDTGLYRETIMEAIASMEESGLLYVTRRNGVGSIYTLVGVEDRHTETSREKHTGSEKPTSREKPTTQSGKADRYQSGKADSESTNESINNRNKKSQSFSEKEMPEIAADLANEFLAYRKAKKSPLTPTAWKGIQREAEKAGWTITAAVEETITRGWQSFKADWVTQKTPQVASSRTRKVFNPVRAA